MAVLYRLQQDNRSNARHPGYWYPKTVNVGTLHTRDLAEQIQQACSLRVSDVEAVLTELAECMRDALHNSHRVHINGIGSFKMGFSSHGAPTAADYSVSRHLKQLHIIFTPELQRDGEGRHTHALVHGCQVAETPKNATR